MDRGHISFYTMDYKQNKHLKYMRATEYLFFVVMIGVFIWIVVAGADSLNKAYSENPVDTTNFTGNYNQIETIQKDANESYSNFQKLGSTETSWFSKIGAGIVAIPYAVAKFPIMVVNAHGALTSMITYSLGFLPAVIILAIFTFLIIEAVRRFLEFYQRARA